MTKFDNLTLSALGRVAAACTRLGIQLDTRWMAAPSSVAQLVIRRSIDKDALTKMREASNTLRDICGDIPLLSGLDMLIQ